MSMSPEQVAAITARRKLGDPWKCIAWDQPGRPNPSSLRKSYVRAGGNSKREKLPIILPNFRLAQAHYEFLAKEAMRRRTTIAATIRSIIDGALSP
jgi:hypothetical protein